MRSAPSMAVVALSAMMILRSVAGLIGLAFSALVTDGRLTPAISARSLADHVRRANSRLSLSTSTTTPATLACLGLQSLSIA
jgi:hypothetical protein